MPLRTKFTFHRAEKRIPMEIPVFIDGHRLAPGSESTFTENVSARGVFFYVDRPLAEGMRVEVTMTFPPHVTLTDPVRVRFTARVVRVDTDLPISRIGVAARIEEYEFLRSNPVGEFLHEIQ